jgi:hypothetical protein
VSRTPRPSGTVTGLPRSRDSAANHRLAVGCGTPASAAARVRFPLVANAASSATFGIIDDGIAS